MKKLLLFLFTFYTFSAIAQGFLNLDFEYGYAENNKPQRWYSGGNGYTAFLDSVVKYNANKSLKIEKTSFVENGFGVCTNSFPVDIVRGHKIVFKGKIKTQDIASGYAGLWWREDGENQSVLNFDNMSNRGLTGTNDWTEVSIEMNVDKETRNINFGGLQTGAGIAWFDNFEIFIDGKKFIDSPSMAQQTAPVKKDTAFSKGSGLSLKLTNENKKSLVALGQLWGFLKYNHPAVAAGEYNWDAELIKILPSVAHAKTTAEWQSILEKWLDKQPQVPEIQKRDTPSGQNIKLTPHYGSLFKLNYLPPSIVTKLQSILKNGKIEKNHYVNLALNVGNPIITNENPYPHMSYPDAGFRLLALFRYWNLVNYFFPYKHLTDEPWDVVLAASLPDFVNAANEQEYMLACLKLIAKVNDTHANIWGKNMAREKWKGMLKVPFATSFIENKLVVTNFYTDTLDISKQIYIGDVIIKINGEGVDDIVKRLLPYTPASNYPTQLRDIARSILRSNEKNVNLYIKRGGKFINVLVPLYPIHTLNTMVDYNPNPNDPAYKILDNDIGYLYPGKYKNAMLNDIKKTFANTKGLVIDMRCYPSEFMPFTFGAYIKSQPSAFVKFTHGSISNPGYFTFGTTISNGSNGDEATYNKKIVIIVNEQTQSQAEYTTMAFQSSPNVAVIGSTTAGADGNVSGFYLPGNIYTMFSGIGVYYPDGTETQRVGVKIDEIVKPTIKGIQSGNDELLQRAIEIINKQ